MLNTEFCAALLFIFRTFSFLFTFLIMIKPVHFANSSDVIGNNFQNSLRKIVLLRLWLVKNGLSSANIGRLTICIEQNIFRGSKSWKSCPISALTTSCPYLKQNMLYNHWLVITGYQYCKLFSNLRQCKLKNYNICSLAVHRWILKFVYLFTGIVVWRLYVWEKKTRSTVRMRNEL